MGPYAVKDTVLGKPRFNTRVPLESLFPMKRVGDVLAAGRKTAPRLDINVYEFTEERMEISLDAPGTGRTLLELAIEPQCRLTVTLTNFEFDDKLKAIIWNSKSHWADANYRDVDPEPRTFFNLNPWADITYWDVNGSLRRKGIGTAWYKGHIEPYLVKCGFKIAAIHGTCQDSPDIIAFWRSVGFVNETHLNPAYDSETKQNFINFKKLPA